MPRVYSLQTKSTFAKNLLDYIKEELRATPEQLENVAEQLDTIVADALDVDPPDPFDKGLRDQPSHGMDAGRSVRAITAAVSREVRAVQRAQELVKPYVGDVPAQRNAGETYKMALDSMGVSTKGIIPGAINRETFLALARARQGNPSPAASASASKALVWRFPYLSRIRQG